MYSYSFTIVICSLNGSCSKTGHVLAKGRNGTPLGREVRVLAEAEGVSLTIPPGGWLWKAEPGRHEGDLGHTRRRNQYLSTLAARGKGLMSVEKSPCCAVCTAEAFGWPPFCPSCLVGRAGGKLHESQVFDSQ